MRCSDLNVACWWQELEVLGAGVRGIGDRS